jgi:uncharacterized LabA/DUF88 family protein
MGKPRRVDASYRFWGVRLSTVEGMKRVCVYVDGFNLYHAIADEPDQRLKWLNFNSIAVSMLRPGEVLEEVYFFTAILRWEPQKQMRHLNFIRAQEAVGVTVIESNFKRVTKKCTVLPRRCPRYEEKQTDVAIATTIMGDAIQGRVDRAILVTADSDQVPLVRQMTKLFPNVAMTLAAPPGRADLARELGSVIQDRIPLTLGRLHAHRLPRDVFDAKGKKVATMPALYRY